MISVLQGEKEGFQFFYTLLCDEVSYGGGLTESNFLCVDEGCPYKELMLRTLINKCIQTFAETVYAEDIWGVDLERFGFIRQGEYYAGSYETLKLPHDCCSGK